MLLMSHAAWMEGTASWRHGRSDSLKALDAAILAAEECNEDDSALMAHLAETIRTGSGTPSGPVKAALDIEDARRKDAVANVDKAFANWAGDHTSSSKDWRKSVRNEKGTIDALYNALLYQRRILGLVPGKEMIDFMRSVRDQSIPAMFKGCEVLTHSTRAQRLSDKMNKVKVAKIARSSYQLARVGHTPSAPSSAPSGGHGLGALSGFASEINTMVQDAFGVPYSTLTAGLTEAESFIRTILTEAIASIKEEITAIAPFVGGAAAAATFTFHTVKLVIKSLDADTLYDFNRRLELGDTRSALDRVRDWQLRDIALTTSKVARAGVNAGMHAAALASMGAAVPAQLAVSIASAVIALGEVVGNLGMQYKEARALSAYLHGTATDKLDAQIFARSPLAAAYYLLNAPDSHIALQLVTIGAPAWRQDVEYLKKCGGMELVLSEAVRLIEASRYRIFPPTGVVYRERIGKTLAVKAKEKVGMEPLRGTRTMDHASHTDGAVITHTSLSGA
jgi:hypothetical protein